MKRFFVMIFSLMVTIGVHALPSEVEVDRLLLKARAALDEKDYASAVESLGKAEKLAVKLPDTFYYHFGKALLGSGDLEKSRVMLERYLNLSGKKGKFYQLALVDLNNIEDTLKKREADAAALARQKEIDRQNALNKYEQDLKEYNQKYAAYERNRDDCPSEYARGLDRQRSAVIDRNLARARGDYDSSKDPEAEALWQRRNDLDAMREYCNGRYREPKKPVPPQ